MLTKSTPKLLLALTSCLILISCQGNTSGRISAEQREKDTAFKDSIALSDADKVLGNIRFGISSEDFRNETGIFLKGNDFSLLGEEIQNIDGLFTNADELCRAIFVSVVEKEKSPKDHPFYPFVSQKFGLENTKNNWLVGKRRIILASENRQEDRNYYLRKVYKTMLSTKSTEYYGEPYDHFKTFNYYVMYIQNDSLYTVYQQEQAESLKQAEEERARQFQDREDAKKAFREKQLKDL